MSGETRPSLIGSITPRLPPAGSLSPAALDWIGRKQDAWNRVRLKRGYPRAALALLRSIHDRWLSADRVVAHFPACSMTNREVHEEDGRKASQTFLFGEEPRLSHHLILLGRYSIGSALAPSATPRISERTALCPSCF